MVPRGGGRPGGEMRDLPARRGANGHRGPLAEGVTESNTVEQLTAEEQSLRSHCWAIVEPFIEV